MTAEAHSIKISLWFYRRIHFTIGYEAFERRLETTKVNARNTSSICPRLGCRSRLKDIGGRTLKCPKCGFIGDRDVVAIINLSHEYLRCGMPRGRPKRPQAR
ncbi:MAG: zinc ribbon domain-containing protein [Acidilobaceae archaeon]